MSTIGPARIPAACHYCLTWNGTNLFLIGIPISNFCKRGLDFWTWAMAGFFFLIKSYWKWILIFRYTFISWLGKPHIESQDNSGWGWKRPLRSCGPAPCPQSGTPSTAQHRVHADVEYFLGGRLHNLKVPLPQVSNDTSFLISCSRTHRSCLEGSQGAAGTDRSRQYHHTPTILAYYLMCCKFQVHFFPCRFNEVS